MHIGRPYVDLTGRQFGKLTVIKRVFDEEKRQGMWLCQCSCDPVNPKQLLVPAYNLTSGQVTSCGCDKISYNDRHFQETILGRRFGRLVVLGKVGSDKHHNFRCRCKCDCGNEVIVTTTQLLKGHTRSCGCYKRDRSSEAHTKYADPIIKHLAVRVMSSMKDRCCNPNNKAYERYGAKGIDICQEWLNNPRAFAEWAIANGYEPGLSIDRIDNNKGYSPDNCRWIPLEDQASNRRMCRYLEVNGETKTIAEWARIMGIRPCGLYAKSDEELTEMVSAYLDHMKCELMNAIP